MNNLSYNIKLIRMKYNLQYDLKSPIDLYSNIKVMTAIDFDRLSFLSYNMLIVPILDKSIFDVNTQNEL